jgi:Kef-type K+ transport system membrane component KefB
MSPWITVPGTLLYVAFMLTYGRNAISWITRTWEAHTRRRQKPSSHADVDLRQGKLAVVLAIAFASAATTDWLGVHPLFGAFLAGVAMPKDRAFVEPLVNDIEDVTTVLLLPIFFVVSGLRTRIDTLDGIVMWLLFAAILITAIAGKLGGAAIAARATGRSWREGLSLGVLVNTRGLVELVLLNIGFEAGIIGPEIFTMLVLMAVVTTVIAAPLFDRIYIRH